MDAKHSASLEIIKRLRFCGFGEGGPGQGSRVHIGGQGYAGSPGHVGGGGPQRGSPLRPPGGKGDPSMSPVRQVAMVEAVLARAQGQHAFPPALPAAAVAVASPEGGFGAGGGGSGLGAGDAGGKIGSEAAAAESAFLREAIATAAAEALAKGRAEASKEAAAAVAAEVAARQELEAEYVGEVSARVVAVTHDNNNPIRRMGHLITTTTMFSRHRRLDLNVTDSNTGWPEQEPVQFALLWSRILMSPNHPGGAAGSPAGRSARRERRAL